jgi:TatA/E family protein of Tat protein translocase
MFGMSAKDVLLVVMIALLLFGAGRLVDIGRDIGKRMRGE